MEDGGAQEKFPPGLNNAFLFAAFNALSFQIILGSPMILYAKNLGASATVLGILAGMMPLLVIFQIPAANYIGRVGYKRFVYAGWGARVMFIYAIAGVTALTFLREQGRLALILFLLFIFNLSRGISSCAWLPWISSLVPETLRGRYLSLDQAFIGVASCLAFIISAACLGETPQDWRFALIFAISGINGTISLSFLKRIPDVPVPEEVRTSRGPVPWGAIFSYKPFQKLLFMNLGWSAAYGGVTTFSVAFLKVETAMADSTILYVTSVAFLGSLLSLWFGYRMDRLGSKPVMIFSSISWVIILSFWTLLAGNVLEPGPVLILGLQFAMGLSAAVFNMANIRLCMVISPKLGRNHFFAAHSVVANMTLGLSPVVWGIFIDLFRGLEYPAGDFVWTRYSLFFLAALAMFLVTLTLMLRLEEPASGKVEDLVRDMFIASPQRWIARVWRR